MAQQILLKRAYEKAAKSDGFRVLVDRLWPRGVAKSDARLDMWAKGVAPSTALRQWFGHDPERWLEFRKRYLLELKEAEAREALSAIIESSHGASAITLVYGAKDSEHNEAVVLRDVLKRKVRSRAQRTG